MRERLSEPRATRGGAFRLHNNIGASETVEGRENAAEGGSRASVADSGRQGKRRILTSFFCLLPAHLPFPAFVLPFLSLHTHFSLSFLLLILSLPADFIPLSYILTCDYLFLSSFTSPMAT